MIHTMILTLKYRVHLCGQVLTGKTLRKSFYNGAPQQVYPPPRLSSAHLSMLRR